MAGLTSSFSHTTNDSAPPESRGGLRALSAVPPPAPARTPAGSFGAAARPPLSPEAARARAQMLGSLKDRMNETGGVPSWEVRHDLPGPPSLFMFIPECRDEKKKSYYDFEGEKSILQSAIAADPAAPPYTVNFTARGSENTGKYALIHVGVKSDAELCAAVDHLTGPLAQTLRDCMTSLVMNAAPETVIGPVSRHLMPDLSAPSPDGKRWKERRAAHPAMPEVGALEAAVEETTARTVRDFLGDAVLPPKQRAAIFDSLPALKPRSRAAPAPGMRMSGGGA